MEEVELLSSSNLNPQPQDHSPLPLLQTSLSTSEIVAVAAAADEQTTQPEAADSAQGDEPQSPVIASPSLSKLYFYYLRHISLSLLYTLLTTCLHCENYAEVFSCFASPSMI